MRRIDTPTAQLNKFGPGKNGFTDGNIQAGRPTTRINGDWFDSHQEEQCNVVEGAGLSLDPNDHTQLLQAIRILAGQSIAGLPIDASTLDGHDSSFFAAAADLLSHIQNRGNPHDVTLAQLGGAPVDSPTFQGNPTAPTPALNDNDTTLATTASVQAVVAAAIQGMGAFTQSFSENGWCLMPNGLLLQWGRLATVQGEGTGPNITFPIAFPNNCMCVIPVNWNRNASAPWDWVDNFVQVVSVAQTQFSTFIQSSGVRDNWDGCFWFAVGH